MTQDRLDIARLVLLGKLSEDHITLAEAYELRDIVLDAVLSKMSETNPTVFWGSDNNTLN